MSNEMDENKNFINAVDQLKPQTAAFETRAIHSGFSPSAGDKGAVIPPIYMATTYEWNCQKEYMYSRVDNPNRKVLEDTLASLEEASFGAVFASGMAAVNAVTTACCSSGDHVIVGENMYGGTIAYFKNIAPRFGIDVTWVDMAKLEDVKAAVRPQTKLVWVESLSNPMMVMVDIEAMRAAIDDMPTEVDKPLLVVDNTFMTPYFMNPLKLGADIVVHSLTKYLNGHCDVLMGAVLSCDEALSEKLKWLQQELGGVPSPLDCSLVLRGIKTLNLRMERHMQSGLKLAKFLENHPCILRVYHPGLATFPPVIKNQQYRGYPGMLTFEMKGSSSDIQEFLRGLKIAMYATSLGAPETLVCLVNAMFASTLDHIGSSPEWMNRHGLIRVSVGLEDPEDLIADFDHSLRAALLTKAR